MRKLFLISIFVLAFGTVAASGQNYYSLTWRKFNQTGPDLQQIGRISVKKSGEINASRWSIGCECLDRNYSNFEAYKDYLPELGVGYARIQSGWMKTEKKEGVYDFSWLDPIVDGLNTRHIKPWMCLSYTNPIYYPNADASLGSQIFEDGPVMDAWLKFVEKVILRYKGRITCYEVWNEPNIKVNAEHPERYANLLVRTCRLIRKKDPDAKIVAFALASFDLKFFKDVLDMVKKKGGTDLFDYVSLHKYYENPDNSDVDFPLFREALDAFNPSIGILQGESGCPSELGWAHALKFVEWDEYRQAKVILRRMGCDFAMSHPCSIFTIADNNCREIHFRQSFGLLCTDLEGTVIYRKPSFYAVKHFVNLLPDEITAGEMEYSANTARRIKLVGLQKGDKTVGVMYWYCDNAPSRELSWDRIELTVEKFRMKKPVLVEPITGRVYELAMWHHSPNATFTRYNDVPVWDSPLLLIDRNEIGFEDLSNAYHTNEF